MQNHAYGLEDVRDMQQYGLKLVKIRNPWGHSGWNGKFCDEDEAWDEYKGLKDTLKYSFEQNGTWWMTFEDFAAHFNKLYICKIFPPTWQQYSITDSWEGKTAGGPYPW